MEDKKFEPLGNYIEQIRGVSYKPSDVYDVKNEESKAILRANNIQNNHANFDDLVFIDKNKISQDQYLKKGDILVCASSGSKNLVGKACLIKEDLDMAFGAFCKVIRTKKLEPRFLGHYFNSDVYRTTISNQAIGANINNIRKEHIDNLLIPMYTKDKQLEIVEKLDKISDMIENQEKQIKKYDDLVKSQFIEMFGDVYSLQNNATHSIGDYVSDKTLKASKLDNTTDIKYIDISSINNQSNEITSYTEYNINERPSRAQQVVNKGDILISTVRPNLNNVAMVTDSFNNMVASTGFCVIKKNEKVNEYFIFTLVKNIEFANYLTKLTTGANYPAVNNKAILDFKIDLPPIELQNQFADFVKHIDKLKLNDMLMEVA